MACALVIAECVPVSSPPAFLARSGRGRTLFPRSGPARSDALSIGSTQWGAVSVPCRYTLLRSVKNIRAPSFCLRKDAARTAFRTRANLPLQLLVPSADYTMSYKAGKLGAAVLPGAPNRPKCRVFRGLARLSWSGDGYPPVAGQAALSVALLVVCPIVRWIAVQATRLAICRSVSPVALSAASSVARRIAAQTALPVAVRVALLVVCQAALPIVCWVAVLIARQVALQSVPPAVWPIAGQAAAP